MESKPIGGEPENDQGGSPIKKALRYPMSGINEIVSKAKNDAMENAKNHK